MGASIRSAFIGLVALCVALTTLACLALSLTSSDKALSDIKSVRDDSVQSCFQVNEDNVKLKVDNIVVLAMELVTDLLTGYFQKYEELVARYIGLLEAGTPETPSAYDLVYQMRPMMYQDMLLYKDVGLSALVFDNLDGSYFRYTYGGGIFGHIHQHPSFGNYSLSSYANTTYLTGLDPVDASGNPVPYQPCPAPDGRDVTFYRCKAQHQTVSGNFQLLAYRGLVGPDKITWGQLVYGQDFMVATLFGVYRRNGAPDGNFFLALSITVLQRYVKSVDLGSKDARIFANIRTDWVGTLVQRPSTWKLTAASHGAMWRTDNTGPTQVAVPILPSESTDPVISHLGRVMEGTNDTVTGLVGYEYYVSNKTQEMEVALPGRNETYYFRTQRLQPGPGFDWFLTVAIDREYLLGAVEAASLAIKTDIQASNTKVDDDLRKASVILYVIIAVLVVVLVGVSVVFVLWITRPLLELQLNMFCVSTMKLEAVQETEMSALDEVKQMQVSFKQMLANIKEYRNYMPASVLCDDGDEEGEESSEGSTHSNSKKSSSMSVSQRSSWKAKGHEAAAKLATGDLKQKQVTYMTINMKQFLGAESQETVKAHERYLTEVLESLKIHKGVPDTFSGDRVYMSWNAVKPVSGSSLHAVSMAWELRGKISGTYGICCGSARCGNMGCATMKKYTFLGGIVPAASLLERLNQVYKSTCLAAGLPEQVTQNVYVKWVDRIQYDKLMKKPLLIVEPMQPKKVSEEEWMYQLEQGDKGDPYKVYNMAVAAYLDREYGKAKELLAACTIDDKQIEAFRERVRKDEGSVSMFPVQCY
eukprot:TRINITY_DN758_c0_g1_i5.p1 TRINITY_DN758_c0_g1~~TRINITY_DN758_c0_g1_i5.p1  ORF type:complete len:814 (+),score=259.00 TRINITY_DN758_c0_g1_i5:810-3251(+)